MGHAESVASAYNFASYKFDEYLDDHSHVHLAVMSSSLATLKATRLHKDKLDANWELNPLQLAVALGEFEMVKYILASGVYEDAASSRGIEKISSQCQMEKSLQHMAASSGHLKVLQYVLLYQCGALLALQNKSTSEEERSTVRRSCQACNE